VFRKLTKILLLTLLVLPFLTFDVYAQQNNQVMAVLCDSTGPGVTVSQPVSDSVVNNPNLNIIGEALRTSQLNIYLNNQYNSSLAITSDPNFQTSITLIPGTNTIRLDATFSCNNTSSQTEIIVDYVPQVIPGNPDTTTSNIDQSSTGQNTVISTKVPKAEPSVIEEIKTKLGLGPDTPVNSRSLIKRSLVKVTTSWLILGLISILLLGILWAPLYLARSSALLKSLFPRLSFLYANWFIRLIVLIIILFLISVFLNG
jgi:hypothetical protein